MKRIVPTVALLGFLSFPLGLHAQDPADDQTGIVGPIADGSPSPPFEPPPLPEFTVRSTITRSAIVEEAPAIPGLPPVKGRVAVTLHRVDDPQLCFL